MRLNRTPSIFALSALIFTGSGAFGTVHAQTATDLAAQRSDLERQLAELQAQIDVQEGQLATVSKEKNTLANKVKQLQAQQASVALKIRATGLRIDETGRRIRTTEKDIDVTEDKAERLRDHISEVLALVERRDGEPQWLYAFLDQGSLTAVFEEVQRGAQLTDSLATGLQEAEILAADLKVKQEALEKQEEEAQNLLEIQNLQRQDLAEATGQQNELLKQTKGKESAYQLALGDTRKQAAAIQNRIYSLIDTGTQITFGKAVEIAQMVSTQTGIRPAFLLAILTQESNLGKNVGTCNRVGDPPNKSWKVVMKPDRDQGPFAQITSALSLNADTTPVSCPMHDKRGKQIGWGGAMGPAQFIPSTWMGYAGKIQAITGTTPNPWDIRDAFLASAIKLTYDGGTGSRDNEWKAAMKYFSGSTNVRFRFYGDNVLATAAKYQADIDELAN